MSAAPPGGMLGALPDRMRAALLAGCEEVAFPDGAAVRITQFEALEEAS